MGCANSLRSDSRSLIREKYKSVDQCCCSKVTSFTLLRALQQCRHSDHQYGLSIGIDLGKGDIKGSGGVLRLLRGSNVKPEK